MSIIIGTAGHIDHGKTTLIQSLTGVHLDSSPEERSRGITISLGFAEFKHPDLAVSFVDVPGHERLIRTMISGATGLHGVLLCISAVDSVMPQTIEHLDILNLLGIKNGIIAITMCDLADEDDLELIHEEIEELVVGTFLEDAPIIHTCAGPSPFGQDELISQLTEICNSVVVEESNTTYPFRLPVDRCFSQKGFGTVVTGTSRGDGLSIGDIVQILPQDIDARVRDIQCGHNTKAHISSGLRVALNLGGIATKDISRGSIVTVPNSLPMTQIIDCSYTHLTRSSEIQSGTRIRLLFGSSETLGKVYSVSDESSLTPGAQSIIQIRLDSPHVICREDRFILRRESPLETLGGGIVLDPYAVKIRNKNQTEQYNFLKQIQSGDIIRLLDRVGEQGRSEQITKLLGIKDGIRLSDRWYATSTVSNFKRRIETFLHKWHGENPLKRGLTLPELKPAVPFLDKTATQELLRSMSEQGVTMQENSVIRLVEFTINISKEEQQSIQELQSRVLVCSLEGLTLTKLNAFSRPLLNYILENALLVRVDNQLIHPKNIDDLEGKLHKFFQEKEQMTTSDFKTMTQLSRKFSIPLLEWMDENQKTLRRGDVRLVGTHLCRK